MATCEPADDAFLVLRWPGVVTRLPERWLIAVSAPNAQTGPYAIEMQSLPYDYQATVPPDDAPAIRNGLLFALGGQLVAAAAPQGSSALLLTEVPPAPGYTPPGLGIVVTGPANDTITATLLPGGGDVNAATRAAWLEATLCCLPPCCAFGSCPGDYQRMHAALAAALIYLSKPANINGSGGGANDFQRMRLGPAELEKGGGAAYKSGTLDGALAQTVPGQYFLRLRARYVFPIICV